MPVRSAGLLLYRIRERSESGTVCRGETSFGTEAGPEPAEGAEAVEVLLVHPGGPFWARRDDGAWSIPKGEVDAGEEARLVARREFAEELGQPAPSGTPRPLGEVRQRGGKVVEAWTVRGDLDVTEVRSNTFELEWPPRSGRRASFPEVDRAAWFPLDEAHRKLLAAQRPLLDRLAELLERCRDL